MSGYIRAAMAGASQPFVVLKNTPAVRQGYFLMRIFGKAFEKGNFAQIVLRYAAGGGHNT